MFINRSRCPITGMLIFIPLVNSPAVISLCAHQNEIERKKFLFRLTKERLN